MRKTKNVCTDFHTLAGASAFFGDVLGAELSTVTSHQVGPALSARLVEGLSVLSSLVLCLRLCRVPSPGFTQCLQPDECVDEDLEQ